MKVLRKLYRFDILALVVQKMDNAVIYPADNAIDFRTTRPLSSDSSGGWLYPAFEQPEPGPHSYPTFLSFFLFLFFFFFFFLLGGGGGGEWMLFELMSGST